jgi:uncharacterized repeat protein (TIGR03803 family)
MMSKGGNLNKRSILNSAAFVTAFLIAASAWATPQLTTLVQFTGTNGSSPAAALIADSSGNLYSTTQFGGTANSGTVFELIATTHTLITLANFTGPPGGLQPSGDLIADSAGNLYGTTFHGGTGGPRGTLFEVAAGTHALSTLVNFIGPNGARPQAGMIADAAGNLYGTTPGGGPSTDGTVFEFTPSTGILTTLASFNGTNGSAPVGDLTSDAAGDLFGTTRGGGASNDGTVFKVAAGTNTLSTVATFNGTNGATPVSSLVFDGAGNLYGTTEDGGTSNDGTVFEIPAGTTTVNTLVNFNVANGDAPFSGLIVDAAGNLFGTTDGGPGGDFGMVFEVAAGTHALSTLAIFNDTNGADPDARLLADTSGNLYGTTEEGGFQDNGTVFEITNSGFVVPEPTSLSMLTLAAPLLLRRRRPPHP